MQKTTVTRRDALKISAFGLAAVTLPLTGALGAKRASEIDERRIPRPFSRPFRVPTTLQPEGTSQGRPLYKIFQREFRAEILPGIRTRMWGYNAQFPGPTIVVPRNQPIAVWQINQLPARHPVLRYEATTSTHLHGAPSLPQYDGYANDLTRPGQFKEYLYDNTEEERTIWYHDHAAHHTSENVYMGLAGQYHVVDPLDTRLPRGKYDVPLIINDVAFTERGELLFDDNSESGVMGDVILVNGVPWPLMQVERRLYRFRLLNASIGRGYRLRLSTGGPMTVVATDGGLVAAPIPVTELRVGMAERYDIVIDFAQYRTGQRVELRNLGVENAIDYDHTDKVMAFLVGGDPTDTGSNALPATLNPNNAVMALEPSQATRTRRLEFERQGGDWVVNDQTWADVEASRFSRVVADPALDAVEIWELENGSGGWFHPIHLHLVDFKILDRNGRPPAPYERGPKDVVYVGENEVVRVIARFGPRQGRYMIHCHNTSHEDHDMMVQMQVGADGPDPITAAPARPYPPI